MWPNLQLPADLVTSTEEILNRNPLCSVRWMMKNIKVSSKTVIRTLSSVMIFILQQKDQGPNQRGEGGESLPCPFSKIGRKCPNLGKYALIVVIYGLNFSFKMQFFRVSRKKDIFFCKVFLSCVVVDCLLMCRNSKKNPLQ